MVVVQPESDPLAEAFPFLSIGEHALAAAPVEFDHAERLDLLLAADAKLLLDFDLDRKTVRVPPSFAQHASSLHRAVTTKQILHRASKHVVNARTPIRRRAGPSKNTNVGAPARASSVC
jgi:hypothetical protein